MKKAFVIHVSLVMCLVGSLIAQQVAQGEPLVESTERLAQSASDRDAWVQEYQRQQKKEITRQREAARDAAKRQREAREERQRAQRDLERARTREAEERAFRRAEEAYEREKAAREDRERARREAEEARYRRNIPLEPIPGHR